MKDIRNDFEAIRLELLRNLRFLRNTELFHIWDFEWTETDSENKQINYGYSTHSQDVIIVTTDFDTLAAWYVNGTMRSKLRKEFC